MLPADSAVAVPPTANKSVSAVVPVDMLSEPVPAPAEVDAPKLVSVAAAGVMVIAPVSAMYPVLKVTPVGKAVEAHEPVVVATIVMVQVSPVLRKLAV